MIVEILVGRCFSSKLSLGLLGQRVAKINSVPFCCSANFLSSNQLNLFYKSFYRPKLNSYDKQTFCNENIFISMRSQMYSNCCKHCPGWPTYKLGICEQMLTFQVRESKDHKRNKSTKKSQKRQEYDSDSESDVEEDLPQGTKLVTVRLQSLRMDGLLKKTLNVARNKVEAAFYEGNIRINGEKPDKKSCQLMIGDELDVVRGLSPMNPEYLNVSRLEVVSVDEDGSDDANKVIVKLKLSKNLYIENYKIHPWKKSSSSE